MARNSVPCLSVKQFHSQSLHRIRNAVCLRRLCFRFFCFVQCNSDDGCSYHNGCIHTLLRNLCEGYEAEETAMASVEVEEVEQRGAGTALVTGPRSRSRSMSDLERRLRVAKQAAKALEAAAAPRPPGSTPTRSLADKIATIGPPGSTPSRRSSAERSPTFVRKMVPLSQVASSPDRPPTKKLRTPSCRPPSSGP